VNLGMPLSLEHVAERFGIPLAKEGQSIAGEQKKE
jgi:hypothetical protein